MLSYPPESIIEYQRDKLKYKQHVERLRAITHTINVDAPSSMSLKHLSTRAKKKQLIEDRHQTIANENRKLMEKMTAIMAEDRKPKKPVKIESMNERERRRFVEKLNKENKVMLQRLETTVPILNAKKLEDDFEKHQKMVEYLKRKRLKPLSSLSAQNLDSKRDSWGSATFDADSYLTQKSSSMTRDNEMNDFESDSPIKNIAEFRKQVISSKRIGSNSSGGIGVGLMNTSKPSTSSKPIIFENLPGMNPNHNNNKIKIQMSHEPTAKQEQIG